MTASPKDVGASVRARLLRLAQSRGEDFQLILTRFVNERLLHRLASSPHASQFILKGATLFALWTGAPHRATRDVDLLGFGDPTAERVRAVFADLLRVSVVDDGVRYDANSLEVVPIRGEQEYGGLRVTLTATVASARVKVQVDVGFGDAVTPAAELVEVPSLLDFPASRLRAYPRETVVAEKLEAMVHLGLANSRMKDFYDVTILAQGFAFDGALLARAVRTTFERRQTMLPDGLPVALTPEFADDPAKRTQWAAFLRKSGLSEARSLVQVVQEIVTFAGPVLVAARGGNELRAATWVPRGPWTNRDTD